MASLVNRDGNGQEPREFMREILASISHELDQQSATLRDRIRCDLNHAGMIDGGQTAGLFHQIDRLLNTGEPGCHTIGMLAKMKLVEFVAEWVQAIADAALESYEDCTEML